MEPVATASIMSQLPGLMSGAGSLLSGLGFGSKKDKGPSLQEQYAAAQGHERDSFNQKMSLAKQHGIHPLAMLGVPMSTHAPYVSAGGGNDGFDFAAIGSGAGQIARSLVKPPEEPAPDPLEKRAAEANVRLLEAQAKRAEWEALGTEWRVADYAAPQILQGQAGNPPGARISNDAVEMRRIGAAQSGLSPQLFGGPEITMKQDVLPPHPVKLGHGAATDQAFVTVMDSKGRPSSVLNQQGIQAEFEDGATMTLLTKLYGVDTAMEIMSVLEQKGLIGGVLAGAAAGGKLLYDYFGRQRRDAEARSKQHLKFKSRNQRKYSIRKGGDQ